MQIESILSFVNGQAPESTPTQVPGSLGEFATLLEGQQAPPESPPPPNAPTFAVVEGATFGMPNATEETPDLTTITGESEAIAQISDEIAEEVEDPDPAVNPDVMALAMLAQSPVTTEVIDVTAFMTHAETVTPVALSAPNATVVVPPTADDVEAPLSSTSAPAETRQFTVAPITTVAPTSTPEPKLEVSPEIKAIPSDTKLVTDVETELLNPVKIESTTINPLQDLMEDAEPANVAPANGQSSEVEPLTQTDPRITPAKISIQGAEPAPTETAETPAAPAMPTVDTVKKQSFRERVDFKTAFAQGFSETIERMPAAEVVANAATPVSKTESKAVDPKSTKITFDSLLGGMRTDASTTPKTVLDSPEAEVLPAGTETFQLGGTDPIVAPETEATLLETLEPESKDTLTPIEGTKAEAQTQSGAVAAKTENPAAPARAELKAEPAQVKEAVHQFVKRAEQFLLARKEGAITIHLEPRELGQITLTVNNGTDGIRAEIKASNQQVQQQLEANKQNLVQQVESKGLSLGSLNVSLNDSSMGQGQNFQERAQASQDAVRQSQLAAIFNQTPNTSSIGSYKSNSKVDGIDYVI